MKAIEELDISPLPWVSEIKPMNDDWLSRDEERKAKRDGKPYVYPLRGRIDCRGTRGVGMNPNLIASGTYCKHINDWTLMAAAPDLYRELYTCVCAECLACNHASPKRCGSCHIQGAIAALCKAAGEEEK